MIFIKDFQHILPKHKLEQGLLQQWIAHIHTEAETKKTNLDKEQKKEFFDTTLKKISSLGLSEDKISTRFMQIDDMNHYDTSMMPIYCQDGHPLGRGLKEKMSFFSLETEKVFSTFFENSTPKDHLIHVTCTGYCSPSAAQKIAAKKKPKAFTTHAYHMGCYAAMPAVRLALGSFPCDIIHTELCSLHVNPLLHTKEQFVVESLFADGFIKYSIDTHLRSSKGLLVLAVEEKIVPDSLLSMTWQCEDFGFGMTLSKNVPFKIASELNQFLSDLAAKAGISEKNLKDTAIFAIHPGGPKIIDQLQKVFEIQQAQVEHSKQILFKRGNMSSATLPHIWESIVDDDTIPSGTHVVSLAFGPGLTISGALLQKG